MNVLQEIWTLVNEMSPYLLLGFFIAGLLHAFVPARLYQRYLGKNNFRSVVWAALIGIPLPLCSCGVIPTAMSLRKEGASKGATTSFLIATPQTGVDSILATASLLGIPFAILRPIAALVTALFGGELVTMATRNEPNESTRQYEEEKTKVSFWKRCLDALEYGFVDMIEDIGKWLVIGLVIAGLITVFVPDDFFEHVGRAGHLHSDVCMRHGFHPDCRSPDAERYHTGCRPGATDGRTRLQHGLHSGHPKGVGQKDALGLPAFHHPRSNCLRLGRRLPVASRVVHLASCTNPRLLPCNACGVQHHLQRGAVLPFGIRFGDEICPRSQTRTRT